LVNLRNEIYYSILAGNEELASKNDLGLILKNETLGFNLKLSNSKTGKGNEIIKPNILLKF
jgi:alpha-glucosidase